MLRLIAVSSRCYGCVNIGYFLSKASKKRLPVLFHFVARVTPDCVFITLNLIDKAGTKPPQIAIGQAFSFCVGAFDVHLGRYARMDELPQSGCAAKDPDVR